MVIMIRVREGMKIMASQPTTLRQVSSVNDSYLYQPPPTMTELAYQNTSSLTHARIWELFKGILNQNHDMLFLYTVCQNSTMNFPYGTMLCKLYFPAITATSWLKL